MAQVSFGDLAGTFQFQRQTARLKGGIDSLTAELASGRTGDLAKTVSGDFAPLAAIESSLSKLDAYETNRAETALSAETIQVSLGKIEAQAGALGPDLLNASSGQGAQALSALAVQASDHLASGVSALNSSVGGRYVFGGDHTDRPAIDVDALSEARAAVAGETSAEAIMDGLDVWFGAGGAFETAAYAGSDAAAEPVAVGPNDRTGTRLTAADSAFRETLKGYVAATLVDSGALDRAEQGELASRAGETLIEAEGLLVARSSEVGVVEGRLAEAKTRNAAERSTLETARNEIVTVDPYETAVKLEETRMQLETLFSATARISALSLTNYL